MIPYRLDPADRPAILWLACLAAAQAVVVLLAGWFGAGGHFMLPLDDSYIHLQYARMAAGGQFLVYTPGMDPSGGMTAPGYVLLLLPVFWLGLEGARAAFCAFLLGAGLWVLLACWVYQLAATLLDRAAGLLAALLVLANGHLLWHSLSGMETALFTVLLTGALLALARWWTREETAARPLLLLCLALLPLVRPEGAAITLAVAAVLLCRRGEAPRLPVLPVLLTLLPFLAWLYILHIATGSWRPAGLIVKGMQEHPYLLPVHRFGIMTDTLWRALFLFYNNIVPDTAYAQFKQTQFLPYVPVGLSLLVALGIGFALSDTWRTRRFGAWVLITLVFLLGIASLLGTYLPFVHQQRYLAPWTVPAILLAVLAARELAGLLHRGEGAAFRAIGAALVLFSLPTLLFWTSEYGRNSRDIYEVLRRGTFPLQAEEHPFAMTDAGVLAYYTDLPAWDLVGLTSREFTPATTHGDAATLAVLASLPRHLRPRLLVTYPGWFVPEFPLGEPEWASAIPRHPSITTGNALTAYPIAWDLVDRADALPAGARGPALLELNVADFRHEHASSYRPGFNMDRLPSLEWPQPLAPLRTFPAPAPLHPDDPVSEADLPAQYPGLPAVDGGRLVRGESFRFALPDGEPWDGLTLYHRVATPEGHGAAALRISATSGTTGYTAVREVPLPSVPGVVEWRVDLGDMLDEAGGTAWRIGVESVPLEREYVSLRYWIVRAAPANGD